MNIQGYEISSSACLESKERNERPHPKGTSFLLPSMDVEQPLTETRSSGSGEIETLVCYYPGSNKHVFRFLLRVSKRRRHAAQGANPKKYRNH